MVKIHTQNGCVWNKVSERENIKNTLLDTTVGFCVLSASITPSLSLSSSPVICNQCPPQLKLVFFLSSVVFIWSQFSSSSLFHCLVYPLLHAPCCFPGSPSLWLFCCHISFCFVLLLNIFYFYNSSPPSRPGFIHAPHPNNKPEIFFI